MYIDYEDLDEAYESVPHTMKMVSVRNDEHRVREKANKPPRRDKWEGVIARNRGGRDEDA